MIRSRWWVWVLLIVLLGTGMRLWRVEEKSLWSDEVATIASAMGNSIDADAYALRGLTFDPPAPVPAAEYTLKATRSHGAANLAATTEVLHYNVHPPLFFWLMNLWIHAAGYDPLPLRLPAILFGILCIPLMWLVGRRLMGDEEEGRWVGAIGAALMAFSAYQVSHAQDARQYTLLMLLALMAVWLVQRILAAAEARQVRWAWAGLTLTLAVGLYSQYFFAPFAGFIYLWLLLHRREKPFLTGTLLSMLGMVLLFLPWWPHFQAQMAFFKHAGHYTGGLWDPVQLPEVLYRLFSDFLMSGSRWGRVLPAIVLLGAAFMAWRRRTTGFHLDPALALLLGWMAAVVGGQLLIDVLKDTHTATIRRYLLLASPAFYLLMGYGVMTLGRQPQGRPWRAVLAAALVLAVTGNTLYRLLGKHHSSDEFRQAARWIGAHAGSNDVVLVNKSGAIAVGMAYYLPPDMPMLGVHVRSGAELAEGSPMSRRVQQAVAGYRGIWLVFAHAAPSTRARMRALLMPKPDAWCVSEVRFPGVMLDELRPGPCPVRR